MKIKLSLVITLFAFLLVACSDPKPVAENDETQEAAEQTTVESVEQATEATSNAVPSLEGNDFLVTIATDLGEMKAILYDQTPLHKENFLKLAREGFYDGVLFHRVINGFMIQGGDPDSKTATPDQRLGAGGPGYKVPAEFVSSLFHVKGALSAARQADQVNPTRASSGSQFYVVQGKVTERAKLEGVNQALVGQAFQTLMATKPESDLAKQYKAFMDANPNDRKGLRDLVFQSADALSTETGISLQMAPERIEAYSTMGGTPFLDDQYTVFGMVIDGLDVIDKIAAVETGIADRPVTDIKMKVTIQELPKADIVAKYGNPYK